MEEVLKLQDSGIELYRSLTELYYWLGEERMARILRLKLQEAVVDNITTRYMLIDERGLLKSREPPSMSGSGESKVTQLQWQEGTNEPEDEPNVSNGEDTLPKKPPTRQPWEQPIVGISGKSKPDANDIDRIYNDGLKRWLAYEETAIKVYQGLSADNKWYKELLHEAMREVESISGSLEAER